MQINSPLSRLFRGSFCRLAGLVITAFFFWPVQATPIITRQSEPVVQDEPGKITTLFLEATGQPPLQIHWQTYKHDFDDSSKLIFTPIAGATNFTFTPPALVSGTQLAAIVKDATGSITSLVSTIVVPYRLFRQVASWPPNFVDIINVARIHGNHLYVFAGSLRIYDISNPVAPVQLALAELGPGFSHTGRRMEVAPPYVYISHPEVISIFNVADPQKPYFVRAIPIDQISTGRFSTDGGLLFVPSVSRLKIYDPLQTLNNSLIGSVSSTNALDVVVRDGIAYVADLTGVLVVDISVPSEPRTISRVPMEAERLSLDGNTLYVCGSALRALDVTDAHAVKRLPNSLQARDTTFLSVRGGIASIGAATGWKMIDVSNPVQSRTIYSEAGGNLLCADYPFAVVGFTNELKLLNLTDPAIPTQVATIEIFSRILQFKYSNRFAFAAAGTHGFIVLDLRNPLDPQEIGRLKFPEPVTSLALRFPWVMLVCGRQTLRTFDISDPFRPEAVSVSTTLSPGRRLVVNETGIALWEKENGFLDILDLRDPSKPVLVGTLPTPAQQATPHRNLFGLTGWDGSFFQLVNVDNPAQPHYFPKYSLPDINYPRARLIAIENDYAYLERHGILDISNPDSIKRVSKTSLLDGGLADGLWIGNTILDVTNPEQPAWLGSFFPSSTRMDNTARDEEYVFARHQDRIIVIHAPYKEPVITFPFEGSLLVRPGHSVGGGPGVDVRSAWPVFYQWYYGMKGDTSHPVPGRSEQFLDWSIELQTNRVQYYWMRASNLHGHVDTEIIRVEVVPRIYTRVTSSVISFDIADRLGSLWQLESSLDLRAWSLEKEFMPPRSGASELIEIPISRVGTRFFRINSRE